MKLKYYLRGAGIGIIIAVLIMVIGGGGTNRTMSDGEIIRRAQELGMVRADESGTVRDYNENKSSQAAQESSSAPSVEAPSEPASTEVPSSAEVPSLAEGESNAAAPSSEAPGIESPTSSTSSEADGTPGLITDGSRVTVTVTAGMLSDKVADLLERAGAIDDAKDFNKYLISKGYDRQILKGDCVIEKGASYEEIAKVLISKSR